jgi:hypothetical protein
MSIVSREDLMATVADDVMAEQERKTMPVRLGFEAIEAGKIAASIKGMSLAEYATAVLTEAANRDIDEWTMARAQGQAPKRKGAK